MSDSKQPKPSKPPQDLADFDNKLHAHSAPERAARKRQEQSAKNSGLATGLRYGTEFAAGILVGAALGYMADRLLGVSPWGLFAGAMLGFAGGVRNVVRAANELNAERDSDAES